MSGCNLYTYSAYTQTTDTYDTLPTMPTPNAKIDRHLPLRPVDFLVLAVLKDGPGHGYGLTQAIDGRSNGTVRVRPGDLYRVLYRMMQQGLLATDQRRPADDLDDARRTYYRITALGRRVVAAEAARLHGLVAEVMAAFPSAAGETT